MKLLAVDTVSMTMTGIWKMEEITEILRRVIMQITRMRIWTLSDLRAHILDFVIMMTQMYETTKGVMGMIAMVSAVRAYQWWVHFTILTITETFARRTSAFNNSWKGTRYLAISRTS